MVFINQYSEFLRLKCPNLTKICYNLRLQQNLPMLNKALKALQPKLISYTKIIL